MTLFSTGCRAPLAATLLLACTLSLAQTPAAPPATAPMAPMPLYASLGGQPGLAALSADFVQRLSTDPRTASFFEKTNRPELAAKLTEQFCAALHGPCRYSGADMKTAHDNMDIRKQDFNALVEVLQQTLNARGVAFADQNRLLALLAPMHRDVINTR